MTDKKIINSLKGLVVVLALVFSGFFFLAEGTEHSLFLDEIHPQFLLPPPPDFPPAWRSRPVSLTPLISMPDGLVEGDTLVVNLFPDKIYTVRIDRVAVNIHGTVSIRGQIQGYPFGYILISTTGDRSLGSIRILERGEFYIKYQRNLLNTISIAS